MHGIVGDKFFREVIADRNCPVNEGLHTRRLDAALHARVSKGLDGGGLGYAVGKHLYPQDDENAKTLAAKRPLSDSTGSSTFFFVAIGAILVVLALGAAAITLAIVTA